MNCQSDSKNRGVSIFTALSISLLVMLLSGCGGLTYPTPIPCGDTDALIRAIVFANTDSDPNTIELSAGCSYGLFEAFDHGGAVGNTGLPQITSEITIIGHGATIRRATTRPKFRLILVGDGGFLLLQDLTLENGYAYDPTHPTNVGRNSGGAIRNKNQLNLENVTIQYNKATAITGGVFNEGNMGMIFSSISGSTQDGDLGTTGGGVALHNHDTDATATIVQSTINWNTSLYTITNRETSTMYIENSTISSNSRLALNNFGDLDLVFSTIANNKEGFFYNYTADITPTVNIIGSLFQNEYTDCFIAGSPLAMNTNNMDSDGSCGFDYTVPSSDQGLQPLGIYGGMTLTHALDPHSPAVDAVVGDCPGFEDQRDVPRPQNGICDIGAYEHDGIIPPVGGEIGMPPTSTPIVPPVDDPGVEPSGAEDDSPPPVPNRCDHFDSENATLTMHDITLGSTRLELFVQYQHKLPGLEEEIPGDIRPWEYTATLGKTVADKCTYREYTGRLYCTFTLTKAHFGFAYPLEVMVNFCEIPIFSHPGVTVFEPEKPTITCSSNLNKSDCQASGGTYHDINQVCSCP